jgi:hypothetical protein
MWLIIAMMKKRSDHNIVHSDNKYKHKTQEINFSFCIYNQEIQPPEATKMQNPSTIYNYLESTSNVRLLNKDNNIV